ncbi:MAG: SMP-30/gluconolactonase/LRE family protein, partial [Bacteroidota bacterium]
QHGDRRLAIMDADINAPQPVFTSIADNYQGKKFNSPNDCARDMNGNFYMTDPPYGLPNQENDTTRQTPWQGVYKIDSNGKVSLLVDSITRPNGIALSPDNKFLYVANSDPAKAIWYRYQLGDSSVVAGSVFYDATADSKSGLPGLPDGFKVDGKGNLFASGPGGVSIFNSSGKLLGRIKLDAPTSNTALSGDEKTLYITNDSLVLRVKLRP